METYILEYMPSCEQCEVMYYEHRPSCNTIARNEFIYTMLLQVVANARAAIRDILDDKEKVFLFTHEIHAHHTP